MPIKKYTGPEKRKGDRRVRKEKRQGKEIRIGRKFVTQTISPGGESIRGIMATNLRIGRRRGVKHDKRSNK